MRYIILDRYDSELYEAESIDEAVDVMVSIASDRSEGGDFKEWARVYESLTVIIRDDPQHEVI